MFELSRPLVSLDVETTGDNPKTDRVVQIGVVKLYPDGRMTEWSTLVNPETRIAPEITAIHGISDDDVADAPRFADIVETLITGIINCDVCGYNVKFDIKFLLAEISRAGYSLMAGLLDSEPVDAFKIYALKQPRTLTAAVKEFLGEDIEGAHDALNDARYALRVAQAQLERYPDLPRDVNQLAALLSEAKLPGLDRGGKLAWRHGEAVFAFGKHRGVRLRDVDRGYLRWILDGDFDADFKAIARSALNGVYPRNNG